MGKIKFNANTASGLLCNFIIYIDGENVGKIKQKSSEIFEVNEGTHVFQIKDSGAFKKSEEKEFCVGNDELIAFNISCNGFKYTIIRDDSKQITIDNSSMILCSQLTPELSEIIDSIEEKGEKVLIAIKGVFREYLICTNKSVYIAKKGFMTGHFLGTGNFHIPYNKITNVEIDMHLLSGYFEISTGGLENKRLNYWSKDPNEDPAKQPNCIALSKDVLKDFEEARDFILNYEVETKTDTKAKSEKSIPEQIREYKELLDDGLISNEEYEEKKKELLNK